MRAVFPVCTSMTFFPPPPPQLHQPVQASPALVPKCLPSGARILVFPSQVPLASFWNEVQRRWSLLRGSWRGESRWKRPCCPAEGSGSFLEAWRSWRRQCLPFGEQWLLRSGGCSFPPPPAQGGSFGRRKRKGVAGLTGPTLCLPACQGCLLPARCPLWAQRG